MEKPATMRVFLTGPNPSLLVAPGRICSVVWRWVQEAFPDHVGIFFGLPQDQVVGRMIPLSRGASAAVNFGSLCESARPDVVISIGDDSDASHVAATLMVGMAQFKWIHILIDGERHQKRPYESITDADTVLAIWEHAADQASRSGCRNVVTVSPTSPIMLDFAPCKAVEPKKYFLVVTKNFETSNLFYLRDEWRDSGLAEEGWELLLALNGADPGDFELPTPSMPAGMRHLWSASSLTYGVPDEDMVDMVKFAWALVDCSLNPATALMAAEAAHLGVGTIATESPPHGSMGIEDILESTPLKSASGRLLHVPQQGRLADAFRGAVIQRPLASRIEPANIMDQLLFHIAGRKETTLEVEVVRPP